MEWTKEQKTIIDYRKGNLLVSAAAGSGKTAVLVQRILEWIVQEGKNIDEFLVVTFTRAAAGQMKNKIRNALEQLQEQQPDNQHIIKQLSLIHRADITTIDSFCKQLVDENFQTLGIDPAMRIMDETEGKLMQEDILTQVLEQAYEQQGEEMLVLHQYMNDIRTDDNIRGLISKIARQADSFPYPEQWLEAAKADAGVFDLKELEQLPWMKVLISEVQSLMLEVKEIPERVMQEYLNLDVEFRPKAYEKYCSYFQEECLLIEQVMQAETYTDILQAFDTSQRVYKRFVWKNSGVPESHYISDLWDYYSRVKKKAAGYVGTSLSDIGRQQQEVAPVLFTILNLTWKFMEEYRKEKQKKNRMDFSDVEHYALQVLVSETEDGDGVLTETAMALQEHYVEILIDEYQDSNDLQEAILTSVAKQDENGYCNLFMVGDVKQSIYKFRMARPQLFQKKYEQYEPDLEKEGNSKKIKLMKNFRSRETVLDSVNAMFYQLMSKSLGGMDYTSQVALVPGRSFPEQKKNEDYRTEVLFLDTVSETEEDTDMEQNTKEQEEKENREEQNKIELEARMAANRIRALCAPDTALPIWDESIQSYRPCMYKDIVILFRTVKGWAETFGQVFLEMGIPLYAETGKGYFDSVEVKDLLCVLAVIDNSRNDIALAGALRSPMVSVTNEEFAYMRSCCKTGDLWEVIHICLQENRISRELQEKLNGFISQLECWKKQKTYNTVRELIWDILNTTGYLEYVGAMPNGKRRQGNLLKLIEKASAYEDTSYRGLFDFLRYIERMKITEQDFGEAAVLGANDNVVRMMSIHKSKGLEFPVVFLCGCGKQFNQKDAEDIVLVDADCYLSVNVKYLDEHYFEKSEKRNCMARHMKAENLAEELRILYVAMTRAQEKLIITGSIDAKTAKNDSCYHELYNEVRTADTSAADIPVAGVPEEWSSLGRFQIESRNSYLSWMIACIAVAGRKGQASSCLTYQIIPSDFIETCVEEEISGLKQRQQHWEQCLSYEATPEAMQEIQQRFCWLYSHQAAAVRKGKLSVSEIKKMSQLIDEPEEYLSWEESEDNQFEKENKAGKILHLEKEPSLGAQYGTLMHLVMEKLSFQSYTSIEQLEEEIDKLVEIEVLTKEERKQISAGKVFHMLTSELGKRMIQAAQKGSLYRERQFVIGVPMKQIYQDTQETDLELVQGIIDAYFEEDGAWVLMDYKTDKVSAEHGEEELIRKYHVQLEYYKQTLEQLTGMKVKETYIYSFYLEKVIGL